MKTLSLLLFVFLLGCNKPKTVLICGDHVCVNKTEAEQFFKENLTLEVKIIDKKDKNEIDLVELNLNKDANGKKRVSVAKKNSTKEKLKVLSSKEIRTIRKNIKRKQKKQKISKNIIKDEKKFKREKKTNKIKNNNISNNVNKIKKDFVDICTLIENCSIDEISKYLLNQGKKKGFPDITLRQ